MLFLMPANYLLQFLTSPQRNNGKGMRLNYENMNKILKSKQEIDAYICEYDDGQKIYVVAETENAASTVADDIIVKTANILKKQDNNYEIPKIQYVTKTDWDKIQPMTGCSDITKSKPAHKDYVPTHRDTAKGDEKYYWDFDRFKQYTLTTVGGLAGIVRFKIPAVYSQRNIQAGDIAKKLFDKTDPNWITYINSIRDANYNTVWYNVKSFDGDSYIVPCTDYDNKDAEIKHVLITADDLFTSKMKALRSIMSNEEITKVVEYAQKHGMTGNNETRFKVTSLKSAADEDNKRCIKELTFDKKTDVSGQLNVERVNVSETKFTIPFLEANEKLKYN